MDEIKIVKKMSELLKTDIDHIVPAIEKMEKEIKKQEKEIKKLKEKMV